MFSRIASLKPVFTITHLELRIAKPVDLNPIEYVAKFPPGDHVMLLYEDLNYAKLIEFSYLLEGLHRKEYCIYGSYKSQAYIESLMLAKGLHVGQFKQQGLLHVEKTETLLDELVKPDLTQHKILSTLLSKVNRPFRMILGFDRERYTKNDLSEHIKLDVILQKVILKARKGLGMYGHLIGKGSILCTYAIDAVTLGNPHLIKTALKSHHQAILVPKHGIGTVLKSNDLLRRYMNSWFGLN